MRKIFRRTAATLLIVTFLLTATLVCAAVKTFDGQGHWHTSDSEGMVYWRMKKYELALADYSKGIEVDPNVMSYLNRAGFYNNVLKNYELAIKDCNKAIKLLTTSQADDTVAVDVNIYLGQACSLRGKAYYGLKNYKAAVKEFNKAIEL